MYNLLGYGYMAAGEIETKVAASYGCGGASSMEPYAITWCPEISGFSTGGLFKGEVKRPGCIGTTATGTPRGLSGLSPYQQRNSVQMSSAALLKSLS